MKNHSKENNKIDKKVLATIIASVSLIVIAIIVLLLFLFAGKDGSKTTNDILRINANNVTLYKGDTLNDYYELSIEDAQISIDVNKNDIIEIDKDKITALTSGEVTVTLIATYNDNSAKDTFTVKVLNCDYSYDVQTIINCSYQNNTLMVEGDYCQFNIEIYDFSGQPFESTDYKFTVTNNAILQKQIGGFILQTTTNCQITFTVPTIDYSFTIEVVKL